MFDLAAAESGKIPANLLGHKKPLKKLPLVFQTIRGQKVSREKLDKLAEVIRKSQWDKLRVGYIPYGSIAGKKDFFLKVRIDRHCKKV